MTEMDPTKILRLVSPTNGTHVGPGVHLPGFAGLPYHGRPYNLKEEDPVELQPKIAGAAFVDILDLAKVEDLERYRKIIQLTIKGCVSISVNERKYDEETKNWRVFLQWVYCYTYNPTEALEGGLLHE